LADHHGWKSTRGTMATCTAGFSTRTALFGLNGHHDRPRAQTVPREPIYWTPSSSLDYRRSLEALHRESLHHDRNGLSAGDGMWDAFFVTSRASIARHCRREARDVISVKSQISD